MMYILSGYAWYVSLQAHCIVSRTCVTIKLTKQSTKFMPGSLMKACNTRSLLHAHTWCECKGGIKHATMLISERSQGVYNKDLSKYRLKLPSLGMFRCADYGNSVIRRICPPDPGCMRSLPASPLYIASFLRVHLFEPPMVVRMISLNVHLQHWHGLS